MKKSHQKHGNVSRSTTITVHHSSVDKLLTLYLSLRHSRLILTILLSISGSEFSNGIKNEWKFPDWVTLVVNACVCVCTWKLYVANFPPFFCTARDRHHCDMGRCLLHLICVCVCFWQCHGSFFVRPSIPSFIILDAEKCGSHGTQVHSACAVCKNWTRQKKTITFVLFIYGILRQPLCKRFPCLHSFEWNHWIKLCVNSKVVEKSRVGIDMFAVLYTKPLTSTRVD